MSDPKTSSVASTTNATTTTSTSSLNTISSLADALKAEVNAAAAAASSSSSDATPSAVAAAADDGAEAEVDDNEDEEDDDEEPVNPLSDDESDTENPSSSSATNNVQLGFLDDPLHPRAMLRSYFPCKVGGKPAWLNPKKLPTVKELTCKLCQQPMVFLLQLYTPLRTTYGSSPATFHRTLFLFCCTTESCTNKRESIICFRSQLPLKNPFYPDVAPKKLDEYEYGENETTMPVLEDDHYENTPLCSVCGNPAPSSCSRCHSRRYCSKAHQVYDWKHGHKGVCQQVEKEVAHTVKLNTALPNPSLLFTQKEIVIEPEEDDDDESADEKKKKGGDYTKESRMLDEFKATQEKEKEEAKKNGEADEEEEEEDLADAVSSWHSTKLKDPLFLKFKARIAENPDQILRYERAESEKERTQPLWVSNYGQPASKPVVKPPPAEKGKKQPRLPKPETPTAEENDAMIPPCTYCGKARRFEFQVLPQLLYYIGSSASSAALDFASLVVYTCEASCGDGVVDGYYEEYTYIQTHVEDVREKLMEMAGAKELAQKAREEAEAAKMSKKK